MLSKYWHNYLAMVSFFIKKLMTTAATEAINTNIGFATARVVDYGRGYVENLETIIINSKHLIHKHNI